MDQAQYRTEDLGVRQFAGSGHAIENCRLHKVALFVAGNLRVTPVHKDFCALLLASADE